ncbi:uncharacterized protein LOC116211490 [Punica granatum]|nr:uncharacterized protein LOC116211490 [Punica granatum]OWM76020.1 hypothetical protein CDL15_Pgr009665 [Punica granatum]
MADNPRGRVTITLGRTGQVVKRPASVSNDLVDPMPSAGSKRSIRDRLGSNGDASLAHRSQMSSKRQRGDTAMLNRSSNGLDDARIDKGDLRYMLMQKNVRRRAESDEERKVADLREKLVKTAYPPASTPDARQRMPERKENGYQMGHSRMPPARSANDLSQSDRMRSPYSPWSMEHLRRRSPERYVSSSRPRSPQRNMEEMQRRPVTRTPDDVRSVPYARRDVLDPPRPMSTAYVANSKHPAATARPSPHLAQNPPPSGSLPRSSLRIEEHQTVDGLLNALELGKYAIIFKAEEVDMAALKQMGEHDLKELGIPMGPRKKILQAITPRPKRQH